MCRCVDTASRGFVESDRRPPKEKPRCQRRQRGFSFMAETQAAMLALAAKITAWPRPGADGTAGSANGCSARQNSRAVSRHRVGHRLGQLPVGKASDFEKQLVRDVARRVTVLGENQGVCDRTVDGDDRNRLRATFTAKSAAEVETGKNAEGFEAGSVRDEDGGGLVLVHGSIFLVRASIGDSVGRPQTPADKLGGLL
jgi:hypothetical protein